ncbi:MAG: protein-disulfide reductase DsbD N-terminal domain-containing protein [Bacteroidota bacterium]
MKKYIISAGMLLSGFCVQAQILTPVKWAYAAKKISNTEAVVLIKATIDKGWHIYSQHVADGGPAKTNFSFAKSDEYAPLNKTTEPQPKKKFEKAFDMNVTYFENTVVFQQKVKLLTSTPTIKGTITYMVCSNKECLPPEDIEFSVAIK